MRAVVVVVVVLVLVLAGAASAEAVPPRESFRLEPVASWLAGKPVAVYCGGVYVGNGVEADGSVPAVGADSMNVTVAICRHLEGWFHGRTPLAGDFADGLLTIAHEAMHLRGIANEHDADCAALPKIPTMLRVFFHMRNVFRRTELAQDAQVLHDAMPPAYSAACDY